MTPTQLEAILAEREACAVEAEECAPVVQCMSVEPVVSACFDIATAIRNRPTPASEEVATLTEIETVGSVDGWTGKPRDLASRQLEAERIAELEAALKQIRDHDAPELNLSNYGPEDVEALNQGWIEVHFIARNTLARP